MNRATLRNSFPVLRDGARRAWTARPWISTREFAAQHFKLVTGQDKGQFFQHERSPYAGMIMDLWDQPWVREILVVAPSQTTKTTIAFACLAAELWRDPSPAGLGMSAQDKLERAIKEKLGAHWLESPLLYAELHPKNPVQTTSIIGKGWTIYGMWAGSEASMSSVTMRVLVIDEEDAYQDKNAPQTMKERVISYPDDSKVMRVSKPRGTLAESVIWRDMQRDAQVIYQWEVCCPKCGAYQLMEKDRIVLSRPERDPAIIQGRRLGRYQCSGCDTLWTDALRNKAVAEGRPHASAPVDRPEVVGVHLPSWLSPQISLSKVLADWFRAHQSGIPSLMVAFDNNHKAMPGNVVALETDADRVRAMITDRPSMEIPAEAWCLTCGIDVQMVGFWFVVRAWGRDGTSWLVQYGFLDTWADVETLIDSTWPVEGRDDVVMPLWRAAIDIGGHEESQANRDAGWSQSEETKNWLYERTTRELIYGTKGASRKMDLAVKPSRIGWDPDTPGKYQTPITIRLLDTDLFKSQIISRMHRSAQTAPMYLHAGTGEDYIRQMCSEKQVAGKDGKIRWEQHGANHLLDCEVMASACAHPDWATNMRQSLAQPDWRRVLVRQKPASQPRSPLSGLRINPNFRP